MMKKLLIASSLFMLGLQASYADSKISQQYTACMNKASSTVSMVQCTSVETARQDARLNKAYNGLMSKLSKTRKQELQTAQRLWIKYRDANCKFYVDPNGGSIAQVKGANCVMNETVKRATELENLAAL
ncbi:DUF1311 domain-containing protein [Acinetobacter sichuanensis]|uniref:DUF1311 domain-containing protein n=2 Tax=Acinetobacter sichuanensis TaxID=2136183 RepID=A0A371YRE4_9GAMM|nr:DUF1311 domain-containing protein [Acinetobacter sichuanensis]